MDSNLDYYNQSPAHARLIQTKNIITQETDSEIGRYRMTPKIFLWINNCSTKISVWHHRSELNLEVEEFQNYEVAKNIIRDSGLKTNN